jgi:hypothetical protein
LDTQVFREPYDEAFHFVEVVGPVPAGAVQPLATDRVRVVREEVTIDE